MLTKFTGLALGSVAVLLLAGCSARHAEPVHHRDESPQESPVVTPNEVNEHKLSLDAFKLRDDSETLPAGITSVGLLETSLKPLSEILFSPAIHLDREVLRSEKFLWALTQFNSDILKLQKMDPAALAASGLLERYEEVVFLDCDKALRGTCKNLKTFGNDFNFPRVLQIMASKPGLDVFEYYRLLKVALERQQTVLNQDLNAMFLERSDDLAKAYLTLKDQKGGDTEQYHVAMRELSRILQNIWADFDPKSVSREKIDSLMAHFQWDMSRKTDEVTAGMDKTLGLAGREYLYEDPGKTKLNSKFVEQVKAIQNGTSELYGQGIRTVYNNIRSGHSSGIFRNLGLATSFDDDEYMYLVDRIYYNHFNTSDAQAFWNFTGRDREKILDAASKFIKIQIANRVVWTNDKMNEFFKNESDEYKSIIPLLIAAVNNASKMAASWDNTRDSIERLVHFVAGLYGNVDIDKLADDHPYRNFHESMADLPHNTKMLSVYPNMMMLVYVMAKNNFNAKIRTFWGAEFTITASQVVKMFFIDVMSPWFSFGTDKTPLTKIELLYAMHFALQTETFKAFTDIPNIEVNAEEFFSEITDKLTQDLRIDLDDQNRVVRAHFENTTKLLRDALVACSEERQMQKLDAEESLKQSRQVVLPRNYVRVFSYEAMGNTLANGFNGVPATPLGSITHFYTGLKLNAALSTMRTKTDERLLYINNLYGMIDSYLEDTTPDAERDQVRAQFKAVYDEHLAPLLQYRDNLVKTTYETLNRFSDCDAVLFRHEMQLKEAVFNEEEAYLNQVYANLVELTRLATQGSSAAADAKLTELNDAMAPTEPGLPDGYVRGKGLDRYVRTGNAFSYSYYKLDSKLRMRRALMRLQPATVITLPNFDRLPEYMNQTPNPLAPAIVLTGTAEEQTAAVEEVRKSFVDDGMRLFAQNINTQAAETPTYMLEKLTMLAQLYRLGPVTKTGARGCVGEDCYRITPEQIIREAITTLKLSDTTPFDLRYMGWKAMEQKHDDKYWAELAMEQGTRRHIGVLDLTLQRVLTDDMDATSGSPSVNGSVSSYFQTKAREYWETEKAVGNYLFRPRASVTQMIKGNYTGYVQDYETKVDEFLAAYERLRTDPDLLITKIQRTRTDVIEIPTETNAEGKTVPVYIFQDRLDRYTSLVTNFHESTKFAFKKDGTN